MSVLTALWRHITKNSPNTQKKYRVAILTSTPSETMSHYVDRLSAYLEILAPHHTTTTVYEKIEEQSVARQFLTDNASSSYDGVLAMDCAAGQSFVRMKHRVGLDMPGVVLGNKELLPEHLPSDVSGFFSPDTSATYFQLFKRMYPQVSRYVIVGRRAIIEKTLTTKNLIKLSREAGIKVDLIYVDDPVLCLEEQFEQHTAGASFVHLTFDVGVFAHIDELVTLSHQYGLLVVASNLHAVHYDADVVIGFPETKVFRYIAHRLFVLMHGAKSPSETFNLQLQLHCNSQNLQKRYQYVLDNIGSILVDGETSVHLHANKQAKR